jgi:hypothetical protein
MPTKLVAQPWAGREEGGEATPPVPAPRRNPPREGRKPKPSNVTTTPKVLATRSRRPTAAKPPPPVESERTTRHQRPARPGTSRSGKTGKPVKGKAAMGSQALCGVGVASDKAHDSEPRHKPVARTEKVQKKSEPSQVARVRLALGVTAQRLPLVDDKSGSTSSGEEEVY